MLWSRKCQRAHACALSLFTLDSLQYHGEVIAGCLPSDSVGGRSQVQLVRGYCSPADEALYQILGYPYGQSSPPMQQPQNYGEPQFVPQQQHSSVPQQYSPSLPSRRMQGMLISDQTGGCPIWARYGLGICLW
jgi:hypothetical protein